MKKSKKYIIISLAVAALAGAGLYGAAKANAFMGYGWMGNSQDTMVNRMAERFGLNKDEVQKVFDEQRSVRQGEMISRFEDRLTQAVSDGKITEAQKKLILEKKDQMLKDMEQWRNDNPKATADQVRDKMQQHRDEIIKWADDNNIPLQYLMGGMGRGGRGMGGFGGNCPMAQ